MEGRPRVSVSLLVSSKTWLFVALLLLMLDLFVPPADFELSTKKSNAAGSSNDRIGTNPIFVGIWRLPPAAKPLGAMIATVVLWYGITMSVDMVDQTRMSSRRKSGGSIWTSVGTFVATAGWALRYWAKSTLDDLFKYQIEPPSRLITAGPFQYLVHPGYAGAMAHMLGVFILLAEPLSNRSLARAVVVVLQAIAMASMRIRVLDEELMLAEHFGDSWAVHLRDRWRGVLIW